MHLKGVVQNGLEEKGTHELVEEFLRLEHHVALLEKATPDAEDLLSHVVIILVVLEFVQRVV